MDIIKQFLANDLYLRVLYSVLVIIIQAVVRRVLLSSFLKSLSDNNQHLYSIRKTINFIITMLSILFLISIWIQRFSDLSVALGIFAAGIAFALQEVIGSIAGWLTIITGKPFSVGDRVETGGIRGDVVDIGILRTKLMEIGNWLSGDQNTGRIVTISNAYIFKEPLYNYSMHLHFIWDEIKVPVTYKSDWKHAAETMQQVALEHPAYRELLPKASTQLKEARRILAVQMTSLEPKTFVKLTDNWIELGLVYPVDTNVRRTVRSEISQKILDAFSKDGVVIASQTLSIMEFPLRKPTDINSEWTNSIEQPNSSH